MSGVNAEQGSMSGSEWVPDDDAANQAASDQASDPANQAASDQASDPAVPHAPTAANGSAQGSGSMPAGQHDSAEGSASVDPSAHGSAEWDGPEEVSVEGLVSDLERVTAERDQYLETSRRIQAEFENYRKQVTKRETEARERANEGLVGEMLPVLDAFDGALSSGVEDVAPMRTTLLEALAKQGLERIDPVEAPFDPNLHEAVMHEEGDGDEAGPVVAEVMRAGYSWKGRVVRPAMVRVRG